MFNKNNTFTKNNDFDIFGNAINHLKLNMNQPTYVSLTTIRASEPYFFKQFQLKIRDADWINDFSTISNKGFYPVHIKTILTAWMLFSNTTKLFVLLSS